MDHRKFGGPSTVPKPGSYEDVTNLSTASRDSQEFEFWDEPGQFTREEEHQLAQATHWMPPPPYSAEAHAPKLQVIMAFLAQYCTRLPVILY